MTELRQLTSARGIAAWLVVGYHIRQSIAGLPVPVMCVLDRGYLAVDFFFLLSGFVIWLAWGQRLRGGDRATIARFLQKRIARIWPLHLAMLAMAMGIVAVLAATGRHDGSFPLRELPLHVLLVQNWGFTDRLSWNDPAWSISCELAAYLLCPVLVAALDWRRLSTAALAGIAATCLLALYVVMADQPDLGADIARFGLARCLAEFATGTILAALWVRGVGRRAWLAAPIPIVGWWLGAPETLVVPAALACLLLALAHTPRLLQGRAIHWLGDISYATYLSHFLLWKIFKLAFVRDAAAVPPPSIALYLVLVLGASALFYHWFERPAQRWVNAWALPFADRPTARPASPGG